MGSASQQQRVSSGHDGSAQSSDHNAGSHGGQHLHSQRGDGAYLSQGIAQEGTGQHTVYSAVDAHCHQNTAGNDTAGLCDSFILCREQSLVEILTDDFIGDHRQRDGRHCCKTDAGGTHVSINAARNVHGGQFFNQSAPTTNFNQANKRSQGDPDEDDDKLDHVGEGHSPHAGKGCIKNDHTDSDHSCYCSVDSKYSQHLGDGTDLGGKDPDQSRKGEYTREDTRSVGLVAVINEVADRTQSHFTHGLCHQQTQHQHGEAGRNAECHAGQSLIIAICRGSDDVAAAQLGSTQSTHQDKQAHGPASQKEVFRAFYPAGCIKTHSKHDRHIGDQDYQHCDLIGCHSDSLLFSVRFLRQDRYFARVSVHFHSLPLAEFVIGLLIHPDQRDIHNNRIRHQNST